MEPEPLSAQLKETCRITGAHWAAFVNLYPKGWEFGAACGLSKARRKAIQSFLEGPKASRWLAGSVSSGRRRSRASGVFAKDLGCRQVILFPDSESKSVIMVGADDLREKSLAFFRVLHLTHQGMTQPNQSLLKPIGLSSLEMGGETGYDFHQTLERILVDITRFLPSEAACMAIRQGDLLRLEVSWNCEIKQPGIQIPIDGDQAIRQITTRRQGLIIENQAQIAGLVESLQFDRSPAAWMGIPLVIGQRVIGLFTLLAFEPRAFSERDLANAQEIANYLAPSVENAIIFAEAERHLQRLALLNELASAASLGLDVEMIAQRVRRMLRRTLHTDRVALLLLSQDGDQLKKYPEEGATAEALFPTDGNSLRSYVLKTGYPIRVKEGSLQAAGVELPSEVQSAMVVPLRYSGNVIGVLEVESIHSNAFSKQDEQLLKVIASHLAGLIENIHLNQETRERAHNLSAIHQIVQHIVGLTDETQIAQIAAELTAEYYGYELTLVLVRDEGDQTLISAGIGGTEADRVPAGIKFKTGKGLIADVIEEGISYLAHQVDGNSRLFPISDWQPGSLMCVPLKEAEQTFGVLAVERSQRRAFAENDLLVLESLAGILSSVMMNAHRYKQLQVTVSQLEAARGTSLDIAELDLDTLLARVVQRARDLVGVAGAELGLIDEVKGVVQILISETPWKEFSRDCIPLKRDVAGRVAVDGEPLVVEDYNTWGGRIDKKRRVPFRSVAGVPLKLKGQVIGTLTLMDDHPERVFQPEDVQLMQILAPQIAVSIRNARLYQELQENIETQRLTEKRLLQSARLAAVGEMAAGVAHELNNPLTTIAGFTELVLDEIPDSSPHHEDLSLVLRESQRARGVVRRLLDFSRQSESIKDPANVNEIITEVMALIHHLARTGGVVQKFEPDANLPMVLVDRNQMKQVVLNLIHNGLQAMPQGGTLSLNTAVDCRDGKDWVVIRVRDTGEGISEENISRIFEPFFTTKPTGSGTGLGLSISYGIVADHNGFMEVDSQPGKGSCFSIWLPVINGEQYA